MTNYIHKGPTLTLIAWFLHNFDLYVNFSLLMAINKRGYENVAERGGYGEAGFRERGAVTLSIKGLHLFSLLPQVSGVKVTHTSSNVGCYM